MAEETSKAPDIDKQRLGSIYATALLGAASSDRPADDLVDELGSLVDDVLTPFPNLEQTLASPRISSADKEGLLDRIFAGRASESLLTFLKVVAANGRLDCLREIRTAAHEELNRIHGRVAVTVTTAESIDENLRGQIVNQLQVATGTPVDLRCRVDAGIIGGMVVRVGDTVYDSSVVNQLARLKRDALGKTFNQLRETIDRFAVSG
jgi:F-type H+-transporting ATPase subunit delta